MAQSGVSSSRNELFFLEFEVDELTGPNLPTNGDVLRYYFYLRNSQESSSSFTPKVTGRLVAIKVIEIWKSNGIPTTHAANGVKYLMNLLKDFKVMRQKYAKLSVGERRRILTVWQRRYELLFSVATKDAVDKCSEDFRKVLLVAKTKDKAFKVAVKKDSLVIESEQVDGRNYKPGPKSSKVKPVDEQQQKSGEPSESPKKPTNTDEHSTEIAAEPVKLVSPKIEYPDIDFTSYYNIKTEPKQEDVKDWIKTEILDFESHIVERAIVKEEIVFSWDFMDNRFGF